MMLWVPLHKRRIPVRVIIPCIMRHTSHHTIQLMMMIMKQPRDTTLKRKQNHSVARTIAYQLCMHHRCFHCCTKLTQTWLSVCGWLCQAQGGWVLELVYLSCVSQSQKVLSWFSNQFEVKSISTSNQIFEFCSDLLFEQLRCIALKHVSIFSIFFSRYNRNISGCSLGVTISQGRSW
jgi:hypothetical protein